MKVLVIGNGGREDALCRKIASSPQVEKLFCSPGNGGTLRYAENVALATNEDIVKFAVESAIDLVVVGPEKPLCEGLVDMLAEKNIASFGANKKSAELEASKDFAKKFMVKYDVPTAKYDTAYDKESAEKLLENYSYPVVIKADGLCAGKGVKIAEDKQAAKQFLVDVFEDKTFGDEGSKVVIEEFLQGREASLLCVVSGSKLYPMESAKDYKRIFEGDKGENTGGVGCYSPSELFTPELNKEVAKVLEKIEHGLEQDNLQYNGILFIGFMIENNVPKILEFNVRFGDPETEVVLPRLESDLLDIIKKSCDGTLTKEDFVWKKEKSLTVILTSKGYPGTYEKGKLITGINDVDNNVFVYHNNTKVENGNVYSDGGRVLSITVLGKDFKEMREEVYRNIEKIDFEGKQYRKDIAEY